MPRIIKNVRRLRRSRQAIKNRSTRSRHKVFKFINDFLIQSDTAELLKKSIFKGNDVTSTINGLKKNYDRTERIINLLRKGEFKKLSRFAGFKGIARPEFKKILSEFEKDFKSLVRNTLEKLLKDRSEFYYENRELITDYNAINDKRNATTSDKKIISRLEKKYEIHKKRLDDEFLSF